LNSTPHYTNLIKKKKRKWKDIYEGRKKYTEKKEIRKRKGNKRIIKKHAAHFRFSTRISETLNGFDVSWTLYWRQKETLPRLVYTTGGVAQLGGQGYGTRYSSSRYCCSVRLEQTLPATVKAKIS
jgi:hypothetical protein